MQKNIERLGIRLTDSFPLSWISTWATFWRIC